jgi:hypothetical protein
VGCSSVLLSFCLFVHNGSECVNETSAEVRLVPGSCTLEYTQLYIVYTECTVFSTCPTPKPTISVGESN